MAYTKSNRWNQDVDLSPLVLRAAADFVMERDAVKEGKHIVGHKKLAVYDPRAGGA